MPIFWFALLLQIIFVNTALPISGIISSSVVPIPVPKWLVTGGILLSSPTHLVIFDALIHHAWGIAWNAFLHVILPVIALTYAILAGVLRFIRAGMVDAANQEYVKTARAKGVPENIVIRTHIRKNALIPTVTVLGLLIAFLLGGIPVIELVFRYYGIGLLAVESAIYYQIYGVMDTTLVFGLVLMVANLVVDIIYGFLDPRIRY